RRRGARASRGGAFAGPRGAASQRRPRRPVPVRGLARRRRDAGAPSGGAWLTVRRRREHRGLPRGAGQPVGGGRGAPEPGRRWRAGGGGADRAPAFQGRGARLWRAARRPASAPRGRGAARRGGAARGRPARAVPRPPWRGRRAAAGGPRVASVGRAAPRSADLARGGALPERRGGAVGDGPRCGGLALVARARGEGGRRAGPPSGGVRRPRPAWWRGGRPLGRRLGAAQPRAWPRAAPVALQGQEGDHCRPAPGWPRHPLRPLWVVPGRGAIL
ncbi:unnamed protein product, partial [Prorocentrum cordatum]